MTSPATHITARQGWQPWMAPVSTGGQAGSRVWGRDLTAEVPSGRRSEPSSESCWGSTFAYGELAPDLLTHMNGRVYDYRLGRFLSVDPIISNPANSQSINPYSYIGNNPLSGVDPTGYLSRSICEGTGRASNCSTGLDPNETVGMKWTATTKHADGTTTSYSWVQMFSNGAKLDNGNNTAVSDHGGPADTNKGGATPRLNQVQDEAIRLRANNPDQAYIPAPDWLIGSKYYYLFRWYVAPDAYREQSGPEYLLDFGFKNIEKFQDLAKGTASPELRDFVKKTGVELQKGLEKELSRNPDLTLSRKDLLDVAYRSHSAAYERGGFGNLTLSDQWRVAFTPDLGDSFGNPKAYPVFVNTFHLLSPFTWSYPERKERRVP